MLYHFEGLLFCTPGERSQIGLVALFDKFRCFFSFRFKKSKWKPMDFCFVLLYNAEFWKKGCGGGDYWCWWLKQVEGDPEDQGELKIIVCRDTKINKSFFMFC